MLNSADIVKYLPHQAGVYRYYDKNELLLYVGKAKDLKKRVSSYFQKGRPKNERLSLMISQIAKIEFTVVDSEKESLILEANLIHSLQPKYNVKLRDDKSYIYVRITHDSIASIFLTRRKYDPQSKYFGPYTRQVGISEVLRTLRSIFPYCQQKSKSNRPCSYYGIGLCEGICAGYEDELKYKEKVNQIASILEGKTDIATNYIQTQIKQAVEKSDFALAALWRNRLKTLNETLASQKVILPAPQDLDIISLVTQNTDQGLRVGSVFVQNIRDGKIINVGNFLLTDTDDNLDDDDLKANDHNLPGDLKSSKNVDNPNSKDDSVYFQFLYKFLASYYSLQTNIPKIMLQIWDKDGKKI